MLSKLVLLNACQYDLAELDFKHGSSMQLVGNNNAGKSSLIYALNFLFLVNKNIMTFSGERPADKETMLHYFPRPEGSFILFEIRKQGVFFCILVFRDVDANPRYTLVEHAYERGLFFETEADGTFRLRTYKDLKKWLVARGIGLEELSQQSEVLKRVYREGRNNRAVVWLTRDNKTSGNISSFSKVYRYLINSRSITTDKLKEILLIANNRERRTLSYRERDMRSIEQLRQQRERMLTLRSIRPEFEDLFESHRQNKDRLQLLISGRSSFLETSTKQRADYQIMQQRRTEAMVESQEQLQRAEQERDRLHGEMGRLDERHRMHRSQRQQLEAQRKNILELPAAPLLEQKIANTTSALDQLKYRLEALRQRGTAALNELEHQHQQIQRERERLQRQLADRDDWLLQHLAQPEDRPLLAAILNRDVARLPSSYLDRPIAQVDRLIQLFDGQFRLPDDFPLPAETTRESLAIELTELDNRQQQTEALLETARNQSDVEKEVHTLETKRQTAQLQLQRVESLSELDQQLSAAEEIEQTLNAERTKLDQQIRSAKQRVKDFREALKLQEKEQRETDIVWKELESQHRELQGWPLPELDTPVRIANLTKDLKQLYSRLKKKHRQYEDQRLKLKERLNSLKAKLRSDEADPDQFLEQTRQELDSLPNLERNIEAIIESVAKQFSNPAAAFLSDYEEFRYFVSHHFNRELASVQISNIESLKIELQANEALRRDLQLIADLDLRSDGLFQEEDTSLEGLPILRRFLESGKEIQFSDFFSLSLKLSVAGREKTVDLSRQIESDGTDRMLRLVIVMVIISRLAHLSEQDRLVLFVDEVATIDGKNRPQLVDFCRQHHFYPIFAAPAMVDGFDRYVFINRDADGRLIVDENRHHLDAART